MHRSTMGAVVRWVELVAAVTVTRTTSVIKRSVGCLLLAGFVLPATLGGPAALAGRAAVTGKSLSTALSDCWNIDNGDPDLHALRVSPTRVDVTDGPKLVTVVVDAVDTGGPGPPSGIKAVRVIAEATGRGFGWGAAVLRPLADGSWRGAFRVLPGYHGWLAVESVEVEDKAGWWREYEASDLEALDLAQRFHVTGQSDQASPRLQNLRLGSRTADVRDRVDSIAVRIRAADDLGVAAVMLRATHAGTGREPVNVSLNRRGGIAQAGLWAGVLGLPQGVRAGTWNLQASIADNVGHRRVLRSPELAAADLPSTISVRSHRDAAPPEVQLVSASPELVDTRAGDTSVRVRVEANDDETGVERVRAVLAIPYYDDDGKHFQDISRGTMTRVADAGGKEFWEANLLISDCQPQNSVEQQPAYTVSLSIQAKDKADNRRWTKFSPVLQLVAPDTVRPIARMADHRVPASGPVTFFFEEPLVGFTSAVIQPYGYERWIAGEPSPIPGTWSCADTTVGVVSCAEGPVRSATFTPDSPLGASTHYLLVPNAEHFLNALDPAGNPALGTLFTTR